MQPGAKWLPNRAALQFVFQLADRRLPAPVFVYEKRNVGFPAGAHHLRGFGQRGRHRFLTDDGQAMRCRQMHQCVVRPHIRDDVQKIESLAAEHLLRVIVNRGYAELPRQFFGFFAMAIAKRDALGPRQLLPRSQLIARPEPGSHDCKA